MARVLRGEQWKIVELYFKKFLQRATSKATGRPLKRVNKIITVFKSGQWIKDDLRKRRSRATTRRGFVYCGRCSHERKSLAWMCRQPQSSAVYGRQISSMKSQPRGLFFVPKAKKAAVVCSTMCTEEDNKKVAVKTTSRLLHRLVHFYHKVQSTSQDLVPGHHLVSYIKMWLRLQTCSLWNASNMAAIRLQIRLNGAKFRFNACIPTLRHPSILKEHKLKKTSEAAIAFRQISNSACLKKEQDSSQWL